MKFEVWIKGRGRGLRKATVTASSFDDVRKKANAWLESGSEVIVKSPSGRTRNYTTR